jgi:hypothetical protein
MVGYEFLLLRVLIVVVAYMTLHQLTSSKERSGISTLLLSIFLLYLILEDVGVYFQIVPQGGVILAVNIISSLIVMFLMYVMVDVFTEVDTNHFNVVSSTDSYIIMKRISAYGLFCVGGLSVLLLAVVNFILIFFYIGFTAMWLGPYMYG